MSPTKNDDPEVEQRDSVEPFATGDAVAPIAAPLIMTDAYVEVNGVNLRCLTLHAEYNPEDKPIDVTTFCGITEYPGPIKWHFVAKFAQSFESGATDATLYAAVQNYQATGAVDRDQVPREVVTAGERDEPAVFVHRRAQGLPVHRRRRGRVVRGRH